MTPLLNIVILLVWLLALALALSRQIGAEKPAELPVPKSEASWLLTPARVTFNAERHEYYAEDGTRLPGVTEILKRVKMIDTSGFSREAAEFGKAVHEATAAIDRGEKRVDDYPEEMQPYLLAWALFKEYRVAEILAIEQIVGGLEVGCAGTLDRLVRLRNGGDPVIIDIKTGLQKPWHRAQLGGYVYASGKPYRRMAVYLKDTGYADGVEFKEQRDITAFRQALDWVKAGRA